MLFAGGGRGDGGAGAPSDLSEGSWRDGGGAIAAPPDIPRDDGDLSSSRSGGTIDTGDWKFTEFRIENIILRKNWWEFLILLTTLAAKPLNFF